MYMYAYLYICLYIFVCRCVCVWIHSFKVLSPYWKVTTCFWIVGKHLRNYPRVFGIGFFHFVSFKNVTQKTVIWWFAGSKNHEIKLLFCTFVDQFMIALFFLCIGSVVWMIVGQFPDRTLPRLTLPRGQIPDGHFPNGHFPERTIPRPDTSPKDTSLTGHFPTKTFPRTDISLAITYFQISAFFSETFC